MKWKLVLLAIGLSFSNIAIGAVMSKKEVVNLQVKHNEEQRNPVSSVFYVFLDASLLAIEQNSLLTVDPFIVTIVKVSTGEILFKAVSHEATYCVDLSHIPSGEHRIEIDTELISLLGYFAF